MGDPLTEKAVIALDRRAVKLDNRVDVIEAKVRKAQAETIREHGLPADLVAVEQNIWRRLSPARNRWPEIAEFDERVGELEQRQIEKAAELRELRDREMAAPAIDADRLATWQLDGEQGLRPEAELPKIREQIRERQEEWEALTRATERVLVDKTEFVQKHRGRLVKDADSHADEAHRRYLELVDQVADVREDLAAKRRAAVWARLYPSEQVGTEPPDTLAGGRKRPLEQMGLSAPVAPGFVFDALRADAAGSTRQPQLSSGQRSPASTRGARPTPSGTTLPKPRPSGRRRRWNGQPTMIGPVERYHRRPKRDKTLDPPPRRCSSPLCSTGWPAREDGPYCLECHFRINDRADALRARNETPKAA